MKEASKKREGRERKRQHYTNWQVEGGNRQLLFRGPLVIQKKKKIDLLAGGGKEEKGKPRRRK